MKLHDDDKHRLQLRSQANRLLRLIDRIEEITTDEDRSWTTDEIRRVRASAVEVSRLLQAYASAVAKLGKEHNK